MRFVPQEMHVRLRPSSIVLCVATLALCSCGPTPDTGAPQNAAETVANEASGGPSAKPSVPATPSDSEAETGQPVNSGNSPQIDEADDSGSENSPPSAVIPEHYRGRWGLVPADCERSDAEGLLRIGERTLRFYESVGALQEQRPAIATSFSGVYSFTGEGESWERVVTLTRNGDRLTRRENDRSVTYTRC